MPANLQEKKEETDDCPQDSAWHDKVLFHPAHLFAQFASLDREETSPKKDERRLES
jgi:hypothetical protein